MKRRLGSVRGSQLRRIDRRGGYAGEYDRRDLDPFHGTLLIPDPRDAALAPGARSRIPNAA
jgi:hypothetical protein